MTRLLSAGNNLSGLWYLETANRAPRSSGYLGIEDTDRFTEVWTAPNITHAAVGVGFMIDDLPTVAGVWVLTLQEDPTGAFSGAEIDVATGSWDMVANRTADTDQLFFIALDTPYAFTTTNVGAYRWKLRATGGASANRIRQSSTSTTNWCFISFDTRTATPSTNDSIFVVHPNTKIDVTVLLGNGTTGAGWGWDHAVYLLTGGDLGFDPGGSYELQLEGTLLASGGGQPGDGVPLDSSVTGTIRYMTSGYADGDFWYKIIRGSRSDFRGTPRTISARYASGAGTTGSPLVTDVDIGLAVGYDILVTMTNGTEQTEEKFIISGSHAAGWVLSDTLGGVESGLSYTHTTDSFILSFPRNITITTDDPTKGWRFDDDHLVSDPMATNDAPNSIYSYVRFQYFFNATFADNEHTGCVLWDSTSVGTAVNFTSRVANTHRENIYGKAFGMTSGGDYFISYSSAKSQAEEDSFFVMANTNSLVIGGVLNTWRRCRWIDNNWDNEANGGAVGRTSTPINCSFIDCHFDGSQNNQFRVRSNVINLRFINCTFGELVPCPWTIQADSGGVYYWEIYFIDCNLDDTDLASAEDLSGGILGSVIAVHSENLTDNLHYRYETNGIIQACGAGLVDTTTRTPGHLAWRFATTDDSSGQFMEFDVPVAPNSGVTVWGYASENSVFFGDPSAVFLMNLIVAGAIVDTYVFSDEVPAADSFEVWILSGIYTGTVSAVATVQIVALTTTPGAHAYFTDFWGGLNEITACNVCVDARPVRTLLQNFADPASVWNVLVSGNTGVGTFGDMVSVDAFGGAIHVDTVNGTDSSAVPYGREGFPCKTEANVAAINAATGIKTVQVVGSLTLTQAWVGFVFRSHNPASGTIDLNGQDVENADFRSLTLQGNNGGANYTARDCTIGTQTGVDATWYSCLLSGAMTIAAGATLNGDGNNFPTETTFDLNGDGSVNLANCSGLPTFQNMTSAGSQIAATGYFIVTLGATCTDGLALFGGIGSLINLSTVPIVIDRIVPEAVWDMLSADHADPGTFGARMGMFDAVVHIDTELAINGDGTEANPFNNFSDAVDYAELYRVHHIHINSDAEVDRQLRGFLFDGIGFPALDLGGNNLDKSEFCGFRLRESYVGSIKGECCKLEDGLEGVNGRFKDCSIGGEITMAADGAAVFRSAIVTTPNTTPATVSLHPTGTSRIKLHNFQGGLIVTDCNQATDVAIIETAHGDVTLAATCTNGNIILRGTGHLVRNDAGAAVNTDAWIEKMLEPLAIEANVEGHAADALTAYDPPTRAEATADKDEILGHIVAASTAAIVGSTVTEVRTGLTQADDFYNDMQLLVINSAGSVVRNIDDYAQANGAFTVEALPFTPAVDDPVIVLARTGSVPVDVPAVVGGVWSELLPGAYGVGSAGKIVGDNIDAKVSTRATQADILSDATPFAGANIDAAITTVLNRLDELIVATETMAVAGSTSTEVRTGLTQADDFYNDMVVVVVNAAGVAVRNIDGYAQLNGALTVTALPFTPAVDDKVFVLARTGSVPVDVSAIVAAVWAELLPGLYGVGSAGKIIGDNLNAAVSSRSSHSAADVWAVATRELTGIGASGIASQSSVDTILAAVVAESVTVGAGSSATEVRTDSTKADGFYDELILVVENASGAVARRITGYLNANGAFTVSPALPFVPAATDSAYVLNRLASAAIDVDALVDAIWDEDVVTVHGAASSSGLLLRVLGNAISTRTNSPTLNALLGVVDSADEDVAKAVDAELTAEHDAGSWSGSGSPATIATAVWSELLPGLFGAGEAGKLIGDNVDAAISSVLSAVTITNAMVKRALGLTHENFMIDNTVYDTNLQMTSARVRLFGSKADLDAATSGGTSPPDPVPIAVYEAKTAWDGINQIQTFKQGLEP